MACLGWFCLGWCRVFQPGPERTGPNGQFADGLAARSPLYEARSPFRSMLKSTSEIDQGKQGGTWYRTQCRAA